MPYQLTVQRNLSNYNVADFRPDPTGTTDSTTAIQNTLNAAKNAGGGIVLNPVAGNYLISAPLVISSNTAFLSGPGVTYTLAASSNCNMIKNTAVTPQRTVTDAAITTATTTLTSATANFSSADVGRTVSVAGAWQGGNVLIANVTVVTNSTTVTLGTAATATVSGASCSIYTRDSNIEVAGGYWQRGNNGYISGVSSPNYQTTQFRHVDNIYIHDLTVACTQRAYQISIGDSTQYTIKNITSVCPNNVTNTDVINIHGPAQFGLIDNIRGVNGDDFVSIHPYDGDGNLRDTVGNVIDLMITNLFPNGNGQASFKTHAGQGTLVRSLTVRGIHGSSLSGAFHIADSGLGPPSDNNAGDIIVEDVDVVTTSSGLGIIYCNNSVGTIILRNLVWRQTLANSQIVSVSNGNSLANLIIDGVNLEAGSANLVLDLLGNVTNVIVKNVYAPDSTIQYNGIVQVESGVTVSTVQVSDCRLTYHGATAQNTVITNKGNITKAAILSNLYISNGGIVYAQRNSGSSNNQVLMNNIVLDNAYQLAINQTSATCDYVINNLNAIQMNQSNFIGITGTGSNFTLRGSGLINPNNYGAFSRDGTQTPRIVHYEMLADLSMLAKNNGDKANNSNGSLACGTGPATSNGSNWKNIYSGSVY